MLDVAGAIEVNDQIVIGRLSVVRVLGGLSVLTSLLTVITYAAVSRGILTLENGHTAHDRRIFVVVIVCLFILACHYYRTVANLLFAGGVGLAVRDGVLIYLPPRPMTLRLERVANVRPGRETTLEGMPDWLAFRLHGGGVGLRVSMFNFATPTSEMLDRLEAVGLAITTRQAARGAPSPPSGPPPPSPPSAPPSGPGHGGSA